MATPSPPEKPSSNPLKIKKLKNHFQENRVISQSWSQKFPQADPQLSCLSQTL